MAKAILQFALYQGTVLLRRESIAQDIVKVGKDSKSHLRIDDPQASRMHAVIEVNGPENITLIDLGNEPGTWVNGVRVNKCKLQEGDRIQVGTTQVVMESASALPVGTQERTPAPAFAAFPEKGNPFAGVAAANPFTTGTLFSGSKPIDRGSDAEQELDPATTGYALIKSGPAVSPEEVELAGVASVELMILWGTNVLHVAHLTPPRAFYVGEEQGKNLPNDFFLPQSALGTTRLPIVVGDRTAIAAIIPSNASGFVEIAGQPRISLEEARGRGQPFAAVAGAVEFALPPGSKVRIEIGQFVFQVAAVTAGKPVPAGVGAGVDWTVASYFGLSLLAHAGLIATMAFFIPPMGLTDDEGIDKEQQQLISQFLASAAEREQERKETEQVAENQADNNEGGQGQRAKDEEGAMGLTTSRATNKRYAVQGPKENPDPHISHAAALRDAATFGMIGILNSGAIGDPQAPTAPWGRDTSLGTDSVSARGNMWGDEIGDASGGSGLGLSGIGEGGGGRGEGLGLGNIGTIGHGAGTGDSQGFGSGHGKLGSGTHVTKAPRVHWGATTVTGRLPPEVIQRIVRQNYGRFRMCYEKGLSKNPNLEGRVQVRFVIGRDGSVSNAANGGSEMPDSGVVQCVVGAYYGLSFPQPEGGIVTVVYPIMFSPG